MVTASPIEGFLEALATAVALNAFVDRAVSWTLLARVASLENILL
jgi:hypothetical protein